MPDVKPQPSHSDPPSYQLTQQPSGLPWPAIAIGLIFIGVIVALGILLLHGTQPRAGSGPSPYSTQLQLSDMKMSQAQNFMGGTVTYLDGQVTNAGDKTVTGAAVEATFKNSLGETVQNEPQPLKLLDRSAAYPDAIDLRIAPLKAQQTREFRLTFEHISTDWNQATPDLRITAVKFQ